jgi:mycothiol system anti-sigma-R factor
MDCRSFRATFFLFTDNEAAQDLVMEIREHAHYCPGCAREMDRAVRVVTIVRQRCFRQVAPSSLRVRILERVSGSRDGVES